MSDLIPASATADGEFLIYQTADGSTRLQVLFQGETVWMTQAQMAELCQTPQQNVSLHIGASMKRMN